MGIRTDTYGNVARVEAMVGDVPAGSTIRTFTTDTTPTKEQVERWLDAYAAELNAKLTLHGYPQPVVELTYPVAFQILRDANAAAAAARVLNSMPGEAQMGTSDAEFPGRASNLFRQFTTVVKMIEAHELPAGRVSGKHFRTYSGSQENSDGETKKPIFTRGIFDRPGTRELTE